MNVLKCGCFPNATKKIESGMIKSCVIHLTDETEGLTQIQLYNRRAQCNSCKTIVPSSGQLAFFQYRGENSAYAKERCKNCAFNEKAHIYNGRYAPHKDGTPGEKNEYLCLNRGNIFEPNGPAQYDAYYCGCYGWD